MTLEHSIRLRRGWECRVAGSQESEAQRLELPIRWNSTVPKRLTLTRRFGKTTLDPAREFVVLRMERVSGILAISINGQSHEPVSAAVTQYSIELDELAERNVLELEIETPALAPRSAGQSEDWGMISLVIRDRATE